MNKNIDGFIRIGLTLALSFSLLSERNEVVKVGVSETVVSLWLLYSIHYKDYLVMVVALVVLVYIMARKQSVA